MVFHCLWNSSFCGIFKVSLRHSLFQKFNSSDVIPNVTDSLWNYKELTIQVPINNLICVFYLISLFVQQFQAHIPYLTIPCPCNFLWNTYYRYTLDTIERENPSSLTISQIEWPMRQASIICPRSKASK